MLPSDWALLRRQDLRFDVASGIEGLTDESHLTLLELERRHLERVLRVEDGHVERAANRLGIPQSLLYQKIRTFGITCKNDR